MKIITIIFVAILAIPVISFAEPAIKSINKNNTINCGYVEYVPSLIKDLNTGSWSGFDYEIMQAIGKRLEIKVEHSVSTGWATIVTDLNARKFDMLCNGFWVHPNVGKFALFSTPIFYQPVFIVARKNDKRFTTDTNLNTADFKMVAIDGDNPIHIAELDFPKAEIFTLPNMTDFSHVLVSVANNRADFTIVDAYTFGIYNENNPDKLKIVSPQKPIRIYPVSYVFNAEDHVLQGAINAAINELSLDGSIDRILNKYDKYPNSYYRKIKPYK